MRKRIKRKSARKNKLILDAVLNVLLVVCFAVFVFSGWKLIESIQEYREGEKTYEAILQEAVIISDHTSSEETVQEEEMQEETLPVIDWAKLESMNDDLVGWLYIPNTAIQYPIVSSTDNDYYLTHTFDKSRNSCGCIFVDKNNKADFSSDNTVLHGHNMKNGTMFGSLRKFEKESYWKEHPYIWIIKEKTAAKYEIFSVGITEAASSVYTLDFDSEDSYANYLYNRANVGAIYQTGVEVTTSDKILTLSTCTSDTEIGRRVVQAKLVEEKVIQ